MAEEGGSPTALVGYCLVAAGVLDLVLGILLLLTEKPADPKQRTVVVGALGVGGLGMLSAGVLLWMGVIG